MKKNFNTFLAACAAFAIVFSCTKAENPVSGTQDGGNYVSEPLGQVTVSAVLSNPMTKVAFDPTVEGGKPTALALTWEAGDQLCVYDAANKENKATLELDAASIGQKTGIFTGNVNFSASSYYVEVLTAGEVADYAAQTQPADGQTNGLKYRAYANTANLTSLEFVNYTTPLAITAKLPSTDVVAAVESVTITASEAIFNGGSTLTVNLGEKGDANDDGILHLYVNLPEENPAIAEGTSLLVKFNTPSNADHTVYTRYVELGAAAFEAGKLNTININASQSDKHASAATCDGSADNPYYVGDVYQMQAMQELVEGETHFALLADIDLADVAWTSLEGQISLEGNGKTISNLKAPLFNDLNGTAANFTLANANVESAGTVGILANTVNVAANVTGVKLNACTLKSTATTAVYVGCLVGEVASASTFEGCEVVGTTLTISANQPHTGGVFGYVHNAAAKISECTIDKTSIFNGKDNVGGFVGLVDGGTIDNCEAACAVSGGSRVGGFVGKIANGSLDKNKFTGTLKCTYQTAGGFAGEIAGGTVTDCSATSGVNYTKNASYSLVGGFVGNMSGGSLTGCTASGTVTITGGQQSGGFVGKMTSNSAMTSCVANVDITSPAQNTGCFAGYVENGSFTGCTVSGSVSGANNTGGLVGYGKNVTISGCHSTVAVSSTGQYVGGLVGYCENSTIETSDYSGAVSTTANYAGGLIGKVSKVIVDQCYAKGSVTVTGGHYVGGLIGQTTGEVTITKSYTENAVGDDKKNHRGGLVGNVLDGTLNVSNSYTSGTIVSSAYSGCFIGGVENAATINVTNSFTNASITGATYTATAFVGSLHDNYTCKGFVAWSNRNQWAYGKTMPDGNFKGVSGTTISAKAREFNWDDAIWDLSKDVPTLKCFAK